MNPFKKKPESKYVCCSCNTAKKHMVPTIEFRTYGEETNWYCLSCLGAKVVRAFLDSEGIYKGHSWSTDIFLDNLKYLDKKDLESIIERLERQIKGEARS